MVAVSPKPSQQNVGRLLRASVGRTIAASAAGLVAGLAIVGCLNLMAIAPGRRATLLLLVIGQQAAFLLAAGGSKGSSAGRVGVASCTAAGFVVMLVASLLGVGYDVALRWLLGADAPTLGPWGALRELDAAPAGAIMVWGVLGGPAADERFFRAGLFDAWREAGHPVTGAMLSSALFALTRLDPLNLPAYFGLGLLLCGAYRWIDSLLVVWIGHGLLNAVMFLLLLNGYA